MTTDPSLIDHTLFDPAAVVPETRRFNEQLETTLAAFPSILDVPAQAEEARPGRSSATSRPRAVK